MLYVHYNKKCLIWHQFITKLFSPVARESAWQKCDYHHALLPQLQSTSSPSAAALTPHPISVQAGLCLQLLAFSLHTQTTSRRTGHKSEHRLRSVAWISEADLLVSELPDIHHKHNTAESHRFELSLLSSGKDCFSLLGTMNGKCNQDVGDNKSKWRHLNHPSIMMQFSTISKLVAVSASGCLSLKTQPASPPFMPSQ